MEQSSRLRTLTESCSCKTTCDFCLNDAKNPQIKTFVSTVVRLKCWRKHSKTSLHKMPKGFVNFQNFIWHLHANLLWSIPCATHHLQEFRLAICKSLAPCEVFLITSHFFCMREFWQPLFRYLPIDSRQLFFTKIIVIWPHNDQMCLT